MDHIYDLLCRSSCLWQRMVRSLFCSCFLHNVLAQHFVGFGTVFGVQPVIGGPAGLSMDAVITLGFCWVLQLRACSGVVVSVFVSIGMLCYPFLWN